MVGSRETGLRALSPLFVLLGLMAVSGETLETVHMVDFCGQTVSGDGMIVSSHADSRRYYFVSMGTDCRLTMRAATPRDKVQFQFRFFLVYSLLRMSNLQSDTSGAGLNGSSDPAPALLSDPCNAGSYVQFYDGKDAHAEPLGTPLCGKTLPRPILSTGDHLTLRLVTRGHQPRVDFVGDFTSFRIGFNASECQAEPPYFLCQNGKCVPPSLVCDHRGIDNCGDASDQSPRPPSSCPSPSRGSLGSRTASEALATPTSSPGCDTGCRHAHPGPRGSDSGRGPHSFLYLYVILGLVVGVAILFWCCWSPGWLIWRLGACRFIPCCNSFCAAAHLCTRSCTRRKNGGRPSKVTPQSPALTTPV